MNSWRHLTGYFVTPCTKSCRDRMGENNRGNSPSRPRASPSTRKAARCWLTKLMSPEITRWSHKHFLSELFLQQCITVIPQIPESFKLIIPCKNTVTWKQNLLWRSSSNVKIHYISQELQRLIFLLHSNTKNYPAVFNVFNKFSIQSLVLEALPIGWKTKILLR